MNGDKEFIDILAPRGEPIRLLQIEPIHPHGIIAPGLPIYVFRNAENISRIRHGLFFRLHQYPFYSPSNSSGSISSSQMQLSTSAGRPLFNFAPHFGHEN